MSDRADPPRNDETTPLLDLTGWRLDQVLGDGDTVLDQAVRRLVRDLDRPGERYSAHGTSVSN